MKRMNVNGFVLLLLWPLLLLYTTVEAPDNYIYYMNAAYIYLTFMKEY